jgi:S1-C subfamily serine protease
VRLRENKLTVENGAEAVFWIIEHGACEAVSREIPLVPGDVILSLNNIPVMTLDGLRTALKQLHPPDPVVLQIERESKFMYLSFELY